MNRRDFLTKSSALSAGVLAALSAARSRGAEILGDERVRGPFPILSTPYTETGEVDYEVLAKEAQYVDDCGSPGMIWPQSGDSVDLLTMEEKMRGMEVLAKAMEGRRSALCLGVQGKDTEEMLLYAEKAKSLNVPAVISRPPDDGTSEEQLRGYWRALAETVSCPIIIQTSGGTRYKGPAPSVELLVELGGDFNNLGYVKEETPVIEARMRKLLANRPKIKRVFSAMGGFNWLYQLRIGSEGLVTERAVYADLLARLWNHYQAGELPQAADLFSKFLLIVTLRDSVPGDLRGFHLYVWQKKGIFKNRLSREYGPNGSIPEKPILRDYPLTEENIDEIELRLSVLDA
ncbi:MAG: dihydrodipicolinate synthase family protein [Thermoguttaceae bacterium]|nr:dihydrodipicolinate synthase family protein [Thermoguttaceae bacterium]